MSDILVECSGQDKESNQTSETLLFRISTGFKRLLCMGNVETRELYTFKEINAGLKTYICQKRLFNVERQKVVNCETDLIGKVFCVDSFGVKDFPFMLNANIACHTITDLPKSADRNIKNKNPLITQYVDYHDYAATEYMPGSLPQKVDWPYGQIYVPIADPPLHIGSEEVDSDHSYQGYDTVEDENIFPRMYGPSLSLATDSDSSEIDSEKSGDDDDEDDDDEEEVEERDKDNVKEDVQSEPEDFSEEYTIHSPNANSDRGLNDGSNDDANMETKSVTSQSEFDNASAAENLIVKKLRTIENYDEGFVADSETESEFVTSNTKDDRKIPRNYWDCSLCDYQNRFKHLRCSGCMFTYKPIGNNTISHKLVYRLGHSRPRKRIVNLRKPRKRSAYLAKLRSTTPTLVQTTLTNLEVAKIRSKRKYDGMAMNDDDHHVVQDCSVKQQRIESAIVHVSDDSIVYSVNTIDNVGSTIENHASTNDIKCSIVCDNTTSIVSAAIIAPSGDICAICLDNSKDSVLIHRNTCHRIACYTCSKILWQNETPCPICRKPILKVCKYFNS